MSDATAMRREEHDETMMDRLDIQTRAEAQAGPEAGQLVAAPGSGAMRRAQWWAATRIELARQIVRRRAIGAMALALLPVLIFGAGALFIGNEIQHLELAESNLVFAATYQGFVLNIVIFFANVIIFSTLVRREMRDRTLHYHFLTPVRREILLIGKYTGGVLTAWLLFLPMTALAFALNYLPQVGARPVEMEAFFFDGPGFAHLGSYLLVTALASMGYGAVFLFLSMFFRNPVVPALSVLAWEMGHFLLPPALKKLSVLHYLMSLLPVPVPEGPFALLSESPSPWVSVFGLVALSAALVAIAAWRFRRQEVLYGED